MKQRFILYRRGEIYYCEDTTTCKQASLHTSDRAEAERLLHARNETVRQPTTNLQIAQVYLQHGDPALTARTWEQVMEQIIATKTGGTLQRWQSAKKDGAFDSLRHRKLIETSAEHFLEVLQRGTVSTIVYRAYAKKAQVTVPPLEH